VAAVRDTGRPGDRPVLLRRRTRPLAATLAGWGAAGLLAVLQLTTDSGELGLRSMQAILVLLYALVRWGSGREILAGTAFVAAVVVQGVVPATPSLTADACVALFGYDQPPSLRGRWVGASEQ